ncbi:hypothetical protein LEP1GSC073_3828 [Leptospira noguchii str. Cascata]|nr:hypothetical protein LEP1GSC073_3828 [Leptospira noguchii str. Cascata]
MGTLAKLVFYKSRCEFEQFIVFRILWDRLKEFYFYNVRRTAILCKNLIGRLFFRFYIDSF